MAKTTRYTTRELAKKFRDTAFRLNQERNDFFLPQIRDFVQQKKWLNLRPEYQRRLVWDDQKRSLFIESLLLNIPIPPVFVYESDLNRYEVMDGQQRLNSVVDFYDNLFPLRGLEKWKELNGSRYGELPETLQRGLDRRRISVTVLLLGGGSDGSPDKGKIRKLVFERLNTGGQHLNAQELRNCLYAGQFNELLTTLSREPLFTRIWGIPPYNQHVDQHGNVDESLRRNPLYRRMVDCEIVLRFFAFRKRTNIKGSVRRMLDRCMIENAGATESEVTKLADDFKSRLTLAHGIFGAHTFKYEDKNQEWQLSHPLYDGVMVALDRLWDKRSQLLVSKTRVASKVATLLKREKAFEIIVAKPNTARAVLDRMEMLTDTIGAAI